MVRPVTRIVRAKWGLAAVWLALAACTATPALELGRSIEGDDVIDASSGPEGSSSADVSAGADGSRPDAGVDGGTPSDSATGNDSGAPNDSGASIDAGDAGTYAFGSGRVASCEQCATGKFHCAATAACTDDCKASCANAPIECVACNAGQQPVAHACEPTGGMSACISGASLRCACNSASDCFGARQVCENNQCLACGETNTTAHDCQGGGKCKTNGANAYECK
jgi:hypothetical protein